MQGLMREKKKLEKKQIREREGCKANQNEMWKG